MTTIPASAIVQVLPNVLTAGGNALQLSAVMLTQSNRVPQGAVQGFPSSLAVQNFFGAASAEAARAAIYFLGYDGSTAKPGNLFFTNFPAGGAAAYLKSGNVQGLGLAALQALSGSLTVVVDGVARAAASIVLSGATSFTAAATLIATGLNGTPTTVATVTGSIAAATAISCTASITGNVMNVTAVSAGTLVPGAILTGTGVTAGTQITSQLSGTTGGIGTYAVQTAQNVVSTTIGGTYGTFTVTAVASGTLSVGQTISGGTTSAGTQITALGTGAGLTGTYYVSPSQVVTSGTITATATPVTCTFDSTSGSFLVTSGILGAPSTVAFATGTLAAGILMTSATGAVLSQGAAATLPGSFMNQVIQVTQNWATFMTVFDPDNGSGNAQKQLFAAWVNSTNSRYAYVCWDTDITPTVSAPATASLGYLLQQSNSGGTILVWNATDTLKAAFICGMIASIDFTAINGRITLMGKHQQGLVADVTTQAISANLDANGYNYYGAYATASQQFVFLNKGVISGQFVWADSYVNQIWLNNALQQALMTLLTQITSIPYTTAGYNLIAAACSDPINAGLTFGAFRAGVPLSALQAANVNNAAGIIIAPTLSAQGYYLQVLAASPQVRSARTSPPINFWYMDGQSVQQISLNSVDVF
jgi:hypothetical protein